MVPITYVLVPSYEHKFISSTLSTFRIVCACLYVQGVCISHYNCLSRTICVTGSDLPHLTRVCRLSPATSERPAVHVSPVVAPPPPPAAASAPSGAAKRWATVQSGPVLEEWQLPARYRRLPMEELEMECINVRMLATDPSVDTRVASTTVRLSVKHLLWSF